MCQLDRLRSLRREIYEIARKHKAGKVFAPEDVTDLGVNITKAKVKGETETWVIKQPKTTAGVRFVPLHHDYIKIIRSWSFKTNPNYITEKFKEACVAVGLSQLHFHCLRHMFVTELYDKGINPINIMKYSGHGSTSVVTNIYTHARRDAAMDQMIVSIMSGETDPKEKKA